MGVHADIRVMRKAEVHNIVEDAVSICITGYSMDYMIWLRVIKPLPIIDFIICRFWGLQESKVSNDLAAILNDKTAILIHISRNDCLRGIAIAPLMHVARLPHNPFCSIHDLHNLSLQR